MQLKKYKFYYGIVFLGIHATFLSPMEHKEEKRLESYCVYPLQQAEEKTKKDTLEQKTNRSLEEHLPHASSDSSAMDKSITFLKYKSEKNNNQDVKGNTPLHKAVLNNDYLQVKHLLVNGEYVNAKNQWQETPLHIAANEGLEEMVELLLSHKMIDVNCCDYTNYTPLHLAAINSHYGIVKYLLIHGADKQVCSFLGETPLDAAIKRDKVWGSLICNNQLSKIIKMLEEKHCDYENNNQCKYRSNTRITKKRNIRNLNWKTGNCRLHAYSIIKQRQTSMKCPSAS